MRAYASITVRDEVCLVGHGDLVGRNPTAAVVVDDPRISEAHAIVSLRKGELHLLALRRLLVVEGKPVGEVRLTTGGTITLADELELVVGEIVEPAAVLAIAMPSGEVLVLPSVASVTTAPPRLHGKLVPDARAVVWSNGDRWSARIGDETRAIEAGSELVVDGERFRFELLALGRASALTTEGDGSVVSPIKLVAYYDAVHIYQRGRKVHTLAGTGARIISELVACDGPTRWDVLARAVWPDETELQALRHRWDVALGRLRNRLRQANARELVRTDGAGQLALAIYPGDEVEDRT